MRRRRSLAEREEIALNVPTHRGAARRRWLPPRRRLPRLVAWAVAWVLAFGGGLLYLLQPTDTNWWLGSLVLALPLIWLVFTRSERLSEAERTPDSGGGGVDGPFFPPDF